MSGDEKRVSEAAMLSICSGTGTVMFRAPSMVDVLAGTSSSPKSDLTVMMRRRSFSPIFGVIDSARNTDSANDWLVAVFEANDLKPVVGPTFNRAQTRTTLCMV